MENIVDFNISQQGFYCWMCHGPLSVLALFCNHCGAIQPVREGDHFQRLGMPRQIDVDFERLDRNLATLQRTFSPERFVLRGQTERKHACQHYETIQHAYDMLRDPIKRSRYWLELHKATHARSSDSSLATLLPAKVADFMAAFARTTEAAALDKLAQRISQEMQGGIGHLLNSLRRQDWPAAHTVLAELDGLESLMTRLRDKRQGLTAPTIP